MKVLAPACFNVRDPGIALTVKAGFAPTVWVQWHRTFFERDKLIPRRIYSVSGGEDLALDIFKMKPKSLCLVVR